MTARFALVAVLAVFVSGVNAAVFQTPAAFVEAAFAGRPPAPKIVWLDNVAQTDIVRILGHRYPAMRLRYWMDGQRSAWVLEEIGKEEPITVGVVVDRRRIELVKVLEFRESRGEEVRYPFFTRQFAGAGFKEDGQLDRPIDGISGATLSVRALTRLVRLALHLDGAVRETR